MLPRAAAGPIVRFAAADGRVVSGRIVSDSPPEVETASGELVAVAVDRMLPPFVPTAIYCIGLNYRAHAAESGLGEPSKYPSACVRACAYACLLWIAVFFAHGHHRASSGDNGSDGAVHFLKPPSCVLGSGGAIEIPRVAAGAPEVDFEGELGVVISAACKNVSKESVCAAY